MHRLRKSFENYLNGIGRLKTPDLGSKKKKSEISKETIQAFIEILNDERGFNRKIALVYIFCIVIYFVIGLFLVFHYLDSPNAIVIIFAIKFLAISLTLKGLRNLWEVKTVIDLSFTLAAGLPPEEMIKIIETIYWGTFRKFNNK